MYPKDYIQYLYHFHCLRDYFECHEILEEFWKEQPEQKKDDHWVGLIQIAVSLYHHRRGNMNGAKKMMRNAISNLSKKKEELETIGLDSEKTLKLLINYHENLVNNLSYKSINLPIKDETLKSICLQEANKHNKKWGVESDLSNNFLINKHTLRDRTDVITSREQELLKRRENK